MMIDLHCHLYYDCDDGPRTKDDSLDLAKALVDAGVSRVAITPHIRSDKNWLNTKEMQRTSSMFSNMQSLLNKEQIVLDICEGAEHYFDAYLQELDAETSFVPYSGSKYILLELPYEGLPVQLIKRLRRVKEQGFHILLAHVERYPYLFEHQDLLQQIVDSGYLLQINLGSLSGAYTRQHKKYAHELLKRGLIHAACGDCHRVKDVKNFIIKGRKQLVKHYGEEEAQRLLVLNPQRILNNETPESIIYT